MPLPRQSTVYLAFFRPQLHCFGHFSPRHWIPIARRNRSEYFEFIAAIKMTAGWLERRGAFISTCFKERQCRLTVTLAEVQFFYRIVSHISGHTEALRQRYQHLKALKSFEIQFNPPLNLTTRTKRNEYFRNWSCWFIQFPQPGRVR